MSLNKYIMHLILCETVSYSSWEIIWDGISTKSYYWHFFMLPSRNDSRDTSRAWIVHILILYYLLLISPTALIHFLCRWLNQSVYLLATTSVQAQLSWKYAINYSYPLDIHTTTTRFCALKLLHQVDLFSLVEGLSA
jgi:hypothetical protein